MFLLEMPCNTVSNHICVVAAVTKQCPGGPSSGGHARQALARLDMIFIVMSDRTYVTGAGTIATPHDQDSQMMGSTYAQQHEALSVLQLPRWLAAGVHHVEISLLLMLICTFCSSSMA